MNLNDRIMENGLVLDDISSTGIDLENFTPGDEGFIIVIDMCIGIENAEGRDDFRFTLADKKGLDKYILNADDNLNQTGMAGLNGYNIHVIDSYSFPKLIAGLREILRTIDVDKNNWRYIAAQLNKHFYWEYEREALAYIKAKRKF